MGYEYNPFTGALDATGASGGATQLIEVEITPQTPGIFTAEGANLIPEGMTLITPVNVEVTEAWDTSPVLRVVSEFVNGATFGDFGTVAVLPWMLESSNPSLGLSNNFYLDCGEAGVSTTGRAIVRLLCAQAISANSAKLLPTVTDGTTSITAPGTLTFQGATVTNDGGNAVVTGEVFSTTVTLTAAQLVDLHNTPVELVPAPGAGKVLLLTDVFGFGSGFNGISQLNCVWAQIQSRVWGTESGYEYYLHARDGLSRQGNCGYATDAPSATAGENEPILVMGNVINLPGAIVSSAVSGGGTGWAVNDTFKIGDAEGVVDSVSTHTITITNETPGLFDTGVLLSSLLPEGTDVIAWANNSWWVNIATPCAGSSPQFGVVPSFASKDDVYGRYVNIDAAGDFLADNAIYTFQPGDTPLLVTFNGATAETPFSMTIGQNPHSVLTYHFTNPGTNNVPDTSVPTTDASGVGTGFTIDITEVDSSNNPATLKIKALYTVMDV